MSLNFTAENMSQLTGGEFLKDSQCFQNEGMIGLKDDHAFCYCAS